MSNVEVNVDSNMNKTDVDIKKIEVKNTDLEVGKFAREPTNIPWSKIIAMVLAVLVMATVCAIAWVFQDWQAALIVFGILVVIYTIAFYWKWLSIAARTAPRDLYAVWCYIKILSLTKKFNKKNWLLPEIFHDVVKRHPNKACFLFENETWTFQQMEDFSLRVSAVLKAQGIKKGDTVGVLCSNMPEMPAIWLGIARVGGVSPLINTNQTGNTLLHSINVAKCDALIYGSEYDKAVQDVKKELSPSLKLLKFTRRPLNTTNESVKVMESHNDFTAMLESTPPPKWFPSEGGSFNSPLLYIYTSGTTGLPKAAVISSSRLVFMASAVQYLGALNTKDVIYCPMPLYHSAGGCVSVGQALVFGCTVALRTKFSASAYIPDCIKFNATVAHYIGEMCRYVLSTPPAATDRQHKVRAVYGNGMRPTIWTDFVNRFGIKRVVEFYGATEGNANIVNVDNKTGAIGFVSRIAPAIYPIAIIKVDQDTGEPIRNKRGLCQLAKANEPGMFIGKIVPNNPSRAFLGYVDKEASKKKVIKDVFVNGDSAFLSALLPEPGAHTDVHPDDDSNKVIGPAGDILVADELGYLYFRDRTGDTFRWRGENVSTTEVEAAVSRVAGHRDAVVYGVEIPNIEGRAGMCGIVDADNSLDLDKLAKDISKDLPKYARPVFIRIMTSIDMTGTFKIRKVDLQKEGYDPATIKDKLYYLEPKLDKYVSLGHEEYMKIQSGQIRL